MPSTRCSSRSVSGWPTVTAPGPSRLARKISGMSSPISARSVRGLPTPTTRASCFPVRTAGPSVPPANWRAERVIELADGDPAMGNIIVGSPLAVSLTMRGIVGSALGRPGWRDDFDRAIEMARTFYPFSRVLTIMLRGIAIGCGAQLPTARRWMRPATPVRRRRHSPTARTASTSSSGAADRRGHASTPPTLIDARVP